jgi:hypothetical protein
MYKLTSTSSRSSSDERSYLPTQPNLPLVVQTLQRQQVATHPPSAGSYVLCHWERGERDLRRKSASLENWDFLAASTALCCAVQCFLLAIGTVRRCTHSNMCASAWLGSPLLASPPLSPLLLPPGHHDRKITPVHLHVHCARTQRVTVCCILYVYRVWPAVIFRGCSFVPLCLAGPFACLASPMT